MRVTYVRYECIWRIHTHTLSYVLELLAREAKSILGGCLVDSKAHGARMRLVGWLKSILVLMITNLYCGLIVWLSVPYHMSNTKNNGYAQIASVFKELQDIGGADWVILMTI